MGVQTAVGRGWQPLDGERVEQKFYLAPKNIPLALALVRRTCRWDAEYPDEQINSLYFDTPDLDFHASSQAGEFSKSKVRIRWYGTECDPHVGKRGEGLESFSPGGMAPVWLELKQRRGFAATKQRRAIEVTLDALRPSRLSTGIVSASTLLTTMAGFGFFSARPLSPAVAISYWRWRFVEPRTGFRVAFDSQIRSSIARLGVGRGERGLRLPGAVVEVKGPSADLPACLLGLGAMGSSWTRFSKYSASIEAHTSESTSVSRLWPSGIVHVESCTAVPRNG